MSDDARVRRSARRLSALLLAFGLIAVEGGCSDCGAGGAEGETAAPALRVFAAASLTDVVEELASEHRRRAGVAIELNVAGTNVLAQQIEAGARADVFLSASRRWIEHLIETGELEAGSVVGLVRNRLAVVAREGAHAPLDAPAELAELPMRHLSIADPRGVPAGHYAEAFLRQVTLDDGRSLYQALEAKLVPAPDVRAALSLVEARSSVVGIVYRSDALSSSRVEILYEVPLDETVDVRYFAGVPTDARHPRRARAFIAFLSSPAAREVFERYGFSPLP